MKKITLLFMCLLCSFICVAQDNYKQVMSLFTEHYNKGQYQEVFDLFDPEMQKALPIDKTQEFLQTLHMQVGNIQKFEIEQKGQYSYMEFKTDCERAVLTLSLSLDANNKINGLFVKPYTPKPKDSTALNDLKDYPTKYGDLIFETLKNFPENTELSVAIIENGLVNYYGAIKENDVVVALDNKDHVFEIGSITKVFTSTVLASLVVDKKIDLKGDISPYFDYSFKDNQDFNFQELANHSSRLPRLPSNITVQDVTNPYKDYSSDDLKDYMQNHLELEDQNQSGFGYSNLGAGLLGQSLQGVSGVDFKQMLQDYIFTPYGLTNTYTSSKQVKTHLVKPKGPQGELVENWDFDSLFAAGGILSTTNDLVRFAIAQFNPNDPVTTLTHQTTLKVKPNSEIALGWFKMLDKQQGELLWHGGATNGYTSSMIIDVENQNAVIILSNVSAFNPFQSSIDKLSLELIKQVNKSDK